ncbi:MAG TPA: NAD(P)(+) transhydrogenase (Re/Si-specific) subunit beta [Acidimicrobiales bacterium]|jgi:NAD(P) transhydrogenase subunit beta|nr:NAD(P)(+) transhydrogenase (Re/Si-specific) subunit beta [Acidimicrobiales bacterium]
MSTFDAVIRILYLVAAAGFVVGLHQMNSPARARRGSRTSTMAMALAVAATLAYMIHDDHVKAVGWIVLGAGTLVGAGGGFRMARQVKLTDIPQLVSLFNAVGGGAAALVAVNDFVQLSPHGGPGLTPRILVTTVLDVIIGVITFTGSLVAAGKLQGLVSGAPIVWPGSRLLNGALTIGSVVMAAFIFAGTYSDALLAGLCAALAVIGVLLVLPIGGADMPVVISLLNAFTGTAVAMAGFVIENSALIIAGALVGASGTILTKLMADAMNRSVLSIVAGGFGTADTPAPVVGSGGAAVAAVSADDAAISLAYASRVIIVPGYGLAAAQAQHEVRALADLLEERGVDVCYAIHPVAGRMPGHMNVLLAEANVPYPQLKEMVDVNPDFDLCDVALVIGANDVVNPAARRAGTAISGMPILDVDHAKSVIVIKRSMSAGYSGLDNDLYTDPKTRMLFADAKAGLTELASAVKELVGT